MNNRARLAVAVLLPLAACTSPRARLPNIAKIYEQAALDEIRNPFYLGRKKFAHESVRSGRIFFQNLHSQIHRVLV